MDRMAEVKERLKIMEDAGMISCGVSEFCMMAAGLILAEHPGADSDKLNMLITHLALAGGKNGERRYRRDANQPGGFGHSKGGTGLSAGMWNQPENFRMHNAEIHTSGNRLFDSPSV